MTDNGSGYRANDLAHACQELGLRPLRTRPYAPRTNGKAERFIQTLLREWAYARPYRTSNQRARRLEPWLRYYNRQRPHSALKGPTPQSRSGGPSGERAWTRQLVLERGERIRVHHRVEGGADARAGGA